MLERSLFQCLSRSMRFNPYLHRCYLSTESHLYMQAHSELWRGNVLQQKIRVMREDSSLPAWSILGKSWVQMCSSACMQRRRVLQQTTRTVCEHPHLRLRRVPPENHLHLPSHPSLCWWFLLWQGSREMRGDPQMLWGLLPSEGGGEVRSHPRLFSWTVLRQRAGKVPAHPRMLGRRVPAGQLHEVPVGAWMPQQQFLQPHHRAVPGHPHLLPGLLLGEEGVHLQARPLMLGDRVLQPGTGTVCPHPRLFS